MTLIERVQKTALTAVAITLAVFAVRGSAPLAETLAIGLGVLAVIGVLAFAYIRERQLDAKKRPPAEARGPCRTGDPEI